MSAGDSGDAVFADDKDWTWVIHEPCPDCGFVAADLDRADLPGRIRENATEWKAILTSRPADELRRRPRSDKWSPLEYGFHVRDAYELYDYRLRLMLEEDGPSFPNWDQDVTAVEKDYRSADPTQVASELGQWAEALADCFSSVEGDQWQRTGCRSDGARFTIDSFGRYLLHDPVHHLWDVHTG